MFLFRSFLVSVGEYTHFAIRSLGAAGLALLRPGATLQQLYAILMGALPLGFVAGIALGAVVWMHTHTVLKRTGTEEYLPTVLAAAVLMELAPIGAGLIVAARTGASLGAELGAMRLTEQIDALEMLGIPPMRELVGPRVLACTIALPLLHIFIAALALLSGYLADMFTTHSSWLAYQSASVKELYMEDVIPAILKTLVFGFLIAVSGCYHGFRASGGTEGVGLAATRGVVTAALLVLLSDILLVGLIQVLH